MSACSAISHLIKRHAVKELFCQRQQQGDLRAHGHWGAFRLFEDRADSATVLDGLAGVLIQACAKAGKGFEFHKLRVGELKVARHFAVGRALCFAANPRN